MDVMMTSILTSWELPDRLPDGFRMDAVKHIKYQYLQEWVDYLRQKTGRELFTVGEYWNYDVNNLHNFITKTSGSMSLFDAPLHMNFYNASRSGGNTQTDGCQGDQF